MRSKWQTQERQEYERVANLLIYLHCVENQPFPKGKG